MNKKDDEINKVYKNFDKLINFFFLLTFFFYNMRGGQNPNFKIKTIRKCFDF